MYCRCSFLLYWFLCSIFFCKNKTAFETGMSDWSSDVCSSDLSLEPTPFPTEVQYPYRIVSDAIDFIDGSGGQPFLLQVGFPEPHTPQQVPKQIGRASCRARVWLYV